MRGAGLLNVDGLINVPDLHWQPFADCVPATILDPEEHKIHRTFPSGWQGTVNRDGDNVYRYMKKPLNQPLRI